MIKIITKELSESLPKNHFLQKNKVINPNNFEKIYNLFNTATKRELCVYDATISTKIEQYAILQIKDHINNTGTNILIGKQIFLNIDFIDQSNLYTHNQNSIIAFCCGKTLKKDKEYPSHYLCHITTLARAMNFNKIIGYLCNTIKETTRKE